MQPNRFNSKFTHNTKCTIINIIYKEQDYAIPRDNTNAAKVGKTSEKDIEKMFIQSMKHKNEWNLRGKAPCEFNQINMY